MGMIYYKQVMPGALTYFFVNPVTRNIEGMIREMKTKDIVSIMKNIDTSFWNDIDHNENAKALIENSIQISQEEYEAAEYIAKVMIETDYWYISEDKIEQIEYADAEEIKEVVTETVVI
jgi:hypothetical protein